MFKERKVIFTGSDEDLRFLCFTMLKYLIQLMTLILMMAFYHPVIKCGIRLDIIIKMQNN